MLINTNGVATQYGLNSGLNNTIIGNTYSGNSSSGIFQFLGNALAPKSMEQDYNAYQAALDRMFNAEQASIERSFNSIEAAKNREFQREMSVTAYRRAMTDMKAAGINPMLAYSLGGASVPAGSFANAGAGARSVSGARSYNTNKSVIFDIIGKVFQFAAGLI